MIWHTLWVIVGMAYVWNWEWAIGTGLSEVEENLVGLACLAVATLHYALSEISH